MKELKYKARKVYELYHEACHSFVTGNGSMVTPYKCPCGEWGYDTKTFDWYLKGRL